MHNDSAAKSYLQCCSQQACHLITAELLRLGQVAQCLKSGSSFWYVKRAPCITSTSAMSGAMFEMLISAVMVSCLCRSCVAACLTSQAI